MDHAEVRDQLDQAAVEPGLLAALGAAAFGHLSVCSECLAEYRALERIADAFALSAAEEPAGTAAPGAAAALVAGRERASDDLRDRTLAFVRAHGVARGASAPVAATSGATDRPALDSAARPTLASADELARGPAARRPWFARLSAAPAWITLAAAAVLVVGVAAAGLGLVNQRDAVVAERAGLAAVTAAVDEIVRQPDHRSVALTPVGEGTAGGSITWSPATGGVVVLSNGLPAPAAGAVYKCWIEQGGQRAASWDMAFSDGVAYWSGSASGWGGNVPYGARFGISLDQVGGTSPGAPLLVGTYN
jgi:hypothetical protein